MKKNDFPGSEDIVETVREPLLVLDANLNILSANRSFYNIFKVEQGETIGHLIFDVGNKQWDIPALRTLLEDILPKHKLFDNYEVEHDFPTIGHKTMLLNARQVYRKDVGTQMILLAIEDITERREIEKGLEKARKELEVTKISEDEAREYAESIINTVREPLIALDQDLRVVTASRSFYEVFKVTPEETVGQLIYDLGNKQWNIPKLRELLETILPQKASFDNYEVEHEFSTIGRRIMLLNARQIQRVSRKERIILLAIEDITERRRLEDLLTESEERYRRLFETANDGILLLEKHEGKITHANPAATEMLGYSKEECIGKKLQNIGVSLDMGDFQKIMQTLDKSGIIYYDDVPVKTKAGQDIDTDIYIVDRAKLVQCNIRDITEHKETEKKIRDSETRFRAIFNSMFQFIGLLRPDGTLIEVNETSLDFAGLSSKDVIGKPFWECYWWNVSADTQDQIRTAVNRAADGEFVRFETPMLGRDGALAIIDFSIKPVMDDVGNVILLIPEGRDITEHKKAGVALEKLRHHNELILNSAGEGIIGLDSQGNHTFVNPSAAGMLGYEFKELIGKSSHTIWHHTKADGSIYPEEECPIYTTLNDGKVHHNLRDEVFWRKDGKSFSVAYSSNPIIDKGKIIGAVVNFRDITERKKAMEQVKRQVGHLAALRDIDKAITSSFDLRVTLKIVLEEVAKQLQVDAADVLLLNHHLQTLEYSAGLGFRTTALRYTRLPFGQGHAGKAAIEQRIIHIPNLHEALVSRQLSSVG